MSYALLLLLFGLVPIAIFWLAAPQVILLPVTD